MAYFAAYLEMLDPQKNQTLRPQHLQHLKDCENSGKLFACGPFANGSGGLVIYIADSYEDAEQLAKKDPYVVEKVRRLDLREWKMTQTVNI
jgi:uncharacterized protein YciI